MSTILGQSNWNPKKKKQNSANAGWGYDVTEW